MGRALVPDAYVFVGLAVAVVAVAAAWPTARHRSVARSFGDRFWSLIVFRRRWRWITSAGTGWRARHRARLKFDAIAGGAAAQRADGRVRCGTEHADLAGQWGLETWSRLLLVRALARRTGVQWTMVRPAPPAAARASARLGPGPELIGRAVAGQCRQPAGRTVSTPASFVHRDDFPLAVRADRGRPAW